ncbi:MAG TPA: GatB/YqeY domain-containing protein [Candidatus Saccharimonadales bacterium]|nr:GatB/YqeY domain-containing protein [Candidatus Saccharimonadales bacterium]
MPDLTLEQRLEQDIKDALMSGDKVRATTLRTLKAVLLNVKVAQGKRESGLSDDEVQQVMTKESKKRQESADLYEQGGNKQKAQAELTEKAVIDSYLPKQLSEPEIAAMVDEAISQTSASGPQDMGKVIGQVKGKAGAAADGSLVARIAKEKLR